jgi:tetratricopeptide (TPR) repeat protein
MLVALATLLILQTPTSPRKPVPLPGVYAHPFHAYKILLPAKWARGPSHGKADASFYSAKVEGYIPRVDLYIQRTGIEFGKFVGEFRKSLKATLADAEFTGDEVTSVRGRTAYQFTVKFNDGPIAMKAIWMAIGREDRVYLLGWACTAAAFDRYAATVDAMARSFRIYDEPKATQEQKEKFVQLYGEGERHYRAQKYAEAEGKFRGCAAILPGYPEIHATLGTARMRLRDFAGAEAAFRRAIELDPDDGSHFYNFGSTLLQQGKYKPAIEALRKATEAEPGMEPAWTNLGAALLAKGDPRAAAQALEKAIAADPESVAAHYNLGCAYERFGKLDKAAFQFRETLKLDPNHEGAKEALKRFN